jgi:hypothetical protein
LTCVPGADIDRQEVLQQFRQRTTAMRCRTERRSSVKETLAQRMLDLIFKDPTVRRTSKDALADWILDTQSRSRPLEASALIDFLASHQPDLFARLKSNVRLQSELNRPVVSVDPA